MGTPEAGALVLVKEAGSVGRNSRTSWSGMKVPEETPEHHTHHHILKCPRPAGPLCSLELSFSVR